MSAVETVHGASWWIAWGARIATAVTIGTMLIRVLLVSPAPHPVSAKGDLLQSPRAVINLSRQ